MNNWTLQQDNLFHQLTLKGALTDALLVLYNTYRPDNKYINKFLQLYKPICQKINQTKVSIKSFEMILDKPFAKGAFGKVTIVKSTADDSIYAMKMIKKSRLISHMDRATPMEERLILSHPNEEWLPKLHASFQDDKYLYLVMEYTPGGDLSFLIDRKQILFTEEVARFYIAELILAIERVHQLGYIHRDIKPGNILIDKCGHIKLGDLGSCIAIDTKEPLSMVGTAFYMSPEMFNSLGNDLNSRSVYGKEVDWWSAGVVLYELLVISNMKNTANINKCQYQPLCTADLKRSLENDPKTALSHEAKDLILRLLSTETDRLGYNGADEIKSHPFFKSVDWTNIHTEKPPFIPEIKSVDDTTYFSGCHEDENEYDNDSEISSDDDDDEMEKKSSHEFPFIGYTFTENFTTKEPFIKPCFLEENPSNYKMKERIELLEEENKTLLKANKEQSASLNELYPLQDQVKQLKKECQTLLEEKTSIYNNFETNSQELDKIKSQLEKEKQDTSMKEQKWFKQMETLKNDLKNQSHQNERILHLEKENDSLLEQLKESRSKINTLQKELDESKRQFNTMHNSKKQNVKSTNIEEDRHLILTAMWERDKQILRTLQNELSQSENKLSKSKLQELRLKKEIQLLQKGKLERKKSKASKHGDIMEGPMKLSFDSNSFRSFYLKLQNGVLDIFDEQSKHSVTALDLRSMLSSVSLSPEGTIAVQTMQCSQAVQDLHNQIKRERNIIASTQRTIAARSRLNRKKNNIDNELENTLKRTLANVEILEKEAEKSNHMLVSSNDKSHSCYRCLKEKQNVYICQNCQCSIHSECVSSAPNCIEYKELMNTAPLLIKTNNSKDIIRWYRAIKLSILPPESTSSHCK